MGAARRGVWRVVGNSLRSRGVGFEGDLSKHARVPEAQMFDVYCAISIVLLPTSSLHFALLCPGPTRR